ncbi:MAG: cobyrinate a,c-diamide synthase [Cyanobacteria bacterium]|nr:cobyrinate a,c-diamide synthase [Cyanobacteriota bacterium]
MGLIIAGERSGAGKTTVTMALLATLQVRQAKVQAFKVGPDYIDPMFHRLLTGRPAYALDPVLTSETYVQQCYGRHIQSATYGLIEGVMGLFDGAGGSDWASTAHIARLLKVPVLLVVDCSRLSRSLAALVHGYRTLDPQVTIAGVVLNRVGSDRHLAMLQAAMASLAMPILGVLRRHGDITLPDRHLGLVPTDELPDLSQRFQRLAQLGKESFDWPQLERLLTVSAAERSLAPQLPRPLAPAPKPRIGIARDRAFNFYYPANLEQLEALGAELVYWSPLTDTVLPADLDGLYLGGGFPEMFAQELSTNRSLLGELGDRLRTGLPTYAECGGLMYLCENLIDFEGHQWPLVGCLPTTAAMTGRLTLGYRQVTTVQDSPLAKTGQTLWGHEFHRSALTAAAAQPLYQTRPYGIVNQPSPVSQPEGWQRYRIHASYIHLHWGSHPELPRRFLQTCHGGMAGQRPG